MVSTSHEPPSRGRGDGPENLRRTLHCADSPVANALDVGAARFGDEPPPTRTHDLRSRKAAPARRNELAARRQVREPLQTRGGKGLRLNGDAGG